MEIIEEGINFDVFVIIKNKFIYYRILFSRARTALPAGFELWSKYLNDIFISFSHI